jgi:hypothetical protein
MTLEQRIRVLFFKYGLILGVIYLGLVIFSFYFITVIAKSPVLFVAGPIFFRLFIPIFLTVFFCFNGRKKIGGYWTFRQATTGIFVMLLTTFLLQFVGKNIVFDNYVEPNNVEKTQVAAINAKESFMKQRGSGQAAIDSSTAELKKEFAQQKNAMTFGSIVTELIVTIIFVFVFAMIFGSLFKNAEPVHTT